MEPVDRIIACMDALPCNESKADYLSERIRAIRSHHSVCQLHPQTLDTLHRLSIHLEELRRMLAIEAEKRIPVEALAEGAIAGFSSDRGVLS